VGGGKGVDLAARRIHSKKLKKRPRRDGEDCCRTKKQQPVPSIEVSNNSKKVKVEGGWKGGGKTSKMWGKKNQSAKRGDCPSNRGKTTKSSTDEGLLSSWMPNRGDQGGAPLWDPDFMERKHVVARWDNCATKRGRKDWRKQTPRGGQKAGGEKSTKGETVVGVNQKIKGAHFSLGGKFWEKRLQAPGE